MYRAFVGNGIAGLKDKMVFFAVLKDIRSKLHIVGRTVFGRELRRVVLYSPEADPVSYTIPFHLIERYLNFLTGSPERCHDSVHRHGTTLEERKDGFAIGYVLLSRVGSTVVANNLTSLTNDRLDFHQSLQRYRPGERLSGRANNGIEVNLVGFHFFDHAFEACHFGSTIVDTQDEEDLQPDLPSIFLSEGTQPVDNRLDLQ